MLTQQQLKLKQLIADGAVAPEDIEFATSISSKVRATTKQLDWVDKLIYRAENKTVKTGTVSVSRIIKMFDLASTHLTYPKVTLMYDEGTLIRISKAGAKSKHPGTLYVTEYGWWVNGEVVKSANRPYLGKITPSGDVVLKATSTEITDLLVEFSLNPEEVAAKYGKITGHCCFCRLHLTDARSLEVGYGPVCAGHYGLTWGKETRDQYTGNFPHANEPIKGDFENMVARAALITELKQEDLPMPTKLETFIQATVKHAIELTFNKGLAMTDSHAAEATKRIMAAVDKSYAATVLASKNKGVTSDKKAASSRANGAKGGRPKNPCLHIEVDLLPGNGMQCRSCRSILGGLPEELGDFVREESDQEIHRCEDSTCIKTKGDIIRDHAKKNGLEVIDISTAPSKVPGWDYCTHCNGYGSSLKDPEGVDTCTRCGGTGDAQ